MDDKKRGHRRSTQVMRETNDYKKLVSKMLHWVFGQDIHIGGAVQVHERQSV